MKIGKIISTCFFLVTPLFISSCETSTAKENLVYAIVPENNGFEVSENTFCFERGDDLVFTLFLEEGYELTNINYENYDLKYASEDKNIEITLNSVQYSLVIEIEVSESTDCIFYDANGGNRLDGLSSDDPIVKPVVRSHLRLNTSTGTKLFERENRMASHEDGCV